ncbi:alkyl sulfatase C-terminal domain-containing protein [Streptomyces nigrescens]
MPSADPRHRGARRPDLLAALTTEQIFQSTAVRINGPRAGDQPLLLRWGFEPAPDRVGVGQDPCHIGRLGERRPVAAVPLSQPPSGVCQGRLPARGVACGRGGGAEAGSSG